SKASVSRLALIQLGDDTYQMLWSCHHILLDGWSAAIIIKDVFAFYEALCEGKTASPEPLPSYPNYLNWIQKQDLGQAGLFWKQQFEGFEKPVLLAKKPVKKTANSNIFTSQSFSLSETYTGNLQSLAREHRLTLGTIIQCVWGLLLGHYAGTRDAVFGTAVSGRNTGLTNMEFLSGMFTNVLPVRIHWTAQTSLSDWLKNTQAEQSGTQNYEFTTLDQITDWIGWPGELPLLDSLLVFENFPWTVIESGGVKVTNFSGGITSTYPVTLVVIPGETLSFEIKFNKAEVSKTIITWFSRQFESLLQSLPDMAENTMADLLSAIEAPPVEKYELDLEKHVNSSQALLTKNGKYRSFITPRNTMELQVAKIWEQIFGRSPIGVTENFFEIGGTSILAVKLLALIEQKLKRNLPPVTLLQNPTIEGLAKILNNNQASPNWSALVPLRTKGGKTPIFCMHAGGGHVYFYHALSKYLDDDQPVYSMQPVGLDGISGYHESIKTMAADYLKEIQSIQPKGPYALLGTCFSNAVCLEIAHQLRKMGESISLLVIVDSGGRELGRRIRKPVQIPPMNKRLKRFVGLNFKDAKNAIRKKITKRFEKLKKKWIILTETKHARKLREMQEHLGKLYEDYYWEPCQEKVTLIRSSEYNEDPNKNFHLERWSAIALGGLSVYVVPGEHLTLFEEPAVEHLARQLQECLDKAHNQPAGGNLSPLTLP
ncbi:MAG: hypothetical protein F6K42_32880, partial [Leptolyngbya sp. SIO1D8]|nr:hypothetical protein [Leptolyngbya sp. SIO1D8]